MKQERIPIIKALGIGFGYVLSVGFVFAQSNGASSTLGEERYGVSQTPVEVSEENKAYYRSRARSARTRAWLERRYGSLPPRDVYHYDVNDDTRESYRRYPGYRAAPNRYMKRYTATRVPQETIARYRRQGQWRLQQEAQEDSLDRLAWRQSLVKPRRVVHRHYYNAPGWGAGWGAGWNNGWGCNNGWGWNNGWGCNNGWGWNRWGPGWSSSVYVGSLWAGCDNWGWGRRRRGRGRRGNR